MKKKLSVVALLLICVLCVIVGLTACDDNNKEHVHECDGSTWLSDANTHWNPCVGEGKCDVKINQEPHYDGNGDGHCDVCDYVVPVEIEGVRLVNAPDVGKGMQVGQSFTLIAEIDPDNATDKTLTWTSSAPHVATVDNSGNVTAVAEGLVTITATASNGLSASVGIAVRAAHTHNMTFVAATEATCHKAGNTAYYSCAGCDKWFADEDGQTEITDRDSVVLAKLTHQFADGECTLCHTPEPTAGLVYEKIWNGAAVTGIGTATATDIVIADEYEGEPVVKIADYAFRDCNTMTSITIPATVTIIEGWGPFEDCDALAAVYYTGDMAGWCNLSGSFKLLEVGTSDKTLYVDGQPIVGDLVIPDGIENIARGAFRGLSGLRSVTIADSVTKIESEAFRDCKDLIAVNIGNGVEQIENEVFAGCSALQELNLGNSLQVIGSSAFRSCEALIEVTIPDSVTQLDGFGLCSDLTSITIGSGVTEIYSYAFDQCYKLIEVYNKSSLNITVGSYDHGKVALYAQNVYTTAGGSKLTTDDNGFVIYDGTVLVDYRGTDKEIVIPDGIVTINQRALVRQTELTGVTIPDSVTTIGAYAFGYCTGLQHVTLGSNVSNIDGYGFSNCYRLIEVYNKSALEITADSTENGYVAYRARNVYTTEGGSKLNVLGDWVIYDDNTLVDYCGTDTQIVIPDGIVTINDGALYGYDGLTGISIPDSVTSIGFCALWGCSGLREIVLPPHLTSIGANALSGCSGLREITIPEEVNDIGSSAFSDCSALETVNWNATCVADRNSNNSDLFYGSRLTTVNVGANVTYIPGFAFDGCEGLSHIVLPDSISLTDVGQDAFRDSAWYEAQPDGVVYLGKMVYTYKGTMPANTVIELRADTVSIAQYAFDEQSNLTGITLPAGLSEIGKHAFSECTGLTAVTLPDNLVVIGNYAFDICTGLTAMTVPDSVTSIGLGAFRGCTGLTSITIPFVGATKYGTENTHVGYIFGAQRSGDNGSDMYWDMSIVVTGGTRIADNAFYGCRHLTSITIPADVTTIGNQAFAGCCSLTDFVIPRGVTVIGKKTFAGCSALTQVTIPDGVKKIDEGAFAECSELTQLLIPDSVTEIGRQALDGCGKLTDIVIPDTVTTLDHVFGSGCNSLVSVTLPLLTERFFYYFDGGVPNSLKHVTITGGTIDGWAFETCDNLTSITIADGITTIGYDAFAGCTALTTIAIADSVTTIGRDAFDNTAWYNNLPDGVVYAGKVAYGYKGTMPEGTSIVLADGTKAIMNFAFSNKQNLASITIPASVERIDASVLSGCTGLTSITLPYVGASKDDYKTTYLGHIFGAPSANANKEYVPDSLKDVTITGGDTIGSNAFKNCVGLSSVTIGGVTDIGNDAFRDCTGLTQVTIRDSVCDIGERAFSGCTALATISMPGSVTSIGVSAFSGCTALATIDLPDGVTSIGDSAFDGCTALATIGLPDSVTKIGVGVFRNTAWYNSQPDGVTYIGNVLHDYKGTMPDNTTVAVQAGTKRIADCAFSGCAGLIDIQLPDTVLSIGERVFVACTALTSIVVPDSVVSIGEGAFDGCTALASLTVPFVGESKTGINFELHYVFGGTVPAALKKVVVTNDNSIGYYAFSGCSVTEVVLGNSVTAIGEGAFSDCAELTNLTIGHGVTQIDGSALSNCGKLTTITYRGTVAEWKSIQKAGTWDDTTGNYTVVCTNGTLDKQGNVVA